ncbi:MAG TPA: UDP-2,3-diacylglucosamine diphosphatase [bacterium]
MERVYFISDVHLGAHQGEHEQRKVEYLNSFLKAIHGKADVLYIVGDLFDFWFEYREAIPKLNLKVLFRLQQFMESGGKLIYLAGNHDLWLDSYLDQELGITVLHQPITASHNSVRLYIAHGDGLARRDGRVRSLNRVFRSRANIFLYRLLHPDLGIPLAKYVANKSRERGENPYDADYREFARAKLSEDFDAVILAHTHKPLFERIDSKYYINLGDWTEHFTYLEMIGDSLKLKSWLDKTAAEKINPKLNRSPSV